MRSLGIGWILALAIGAAALPARAEGKADAPQAVELPDENSSEPESNSVAEPDDSAPTEAVLFFGDAGDPLFDDDFDLDDAAGFPDPLEEPNRTVLVFNQGLDTFLLGPITSFFGWATPEPLKLGLQNFFANLNTPVVLINDMLQLEWKDAATTTGAFVVNTTVGIGGFFEPAKSIGMPRHESDFGQTLALARVPSGPYLMLPIAGPSTARGTVGSVVDFFMRPNTWILPVTNFYYYSGEGVVTLEKHREKLKALEETSVDYYSVLRSAYYQTRTDDIWARRQDRRPSEQD